MEPVFHSIHHKMNRHLCGLLHFEHITPNGVLLLTFSEYVIKRFGKSSYRLSNGSCR